MFKYIASILKTISPAQRVIALSLLLLSITLITIGPKIVNSFTQDNEELKNKIKIQRTEITDLSDRVKELNKQVLANQQECTNSRIQREGEILIALAEIEREALKGNAKRHIVSNSMARYNDSGPVVSMMILPEPEAAPDNSKMLNLVKNLKSNIQKDLK